MGIVTIDCPASATVPLCHDGSNVLCAMDTSGPSRSPGGKACTGVLVSAVAERVEVIGETLELFMIRSFCLCCSFAVGSRAAACFPTYTCWRTVDGTRHARAAMFLSSALTDWDMPLPRHTPSGLASPGDAPGLTLCGPTLIHSNSFCPLGPLLGGVPVCEDGMGTSLVLLHKRSCVELDLRPS